MGNRLFFRAPMAPSNANNDKGENMKWPLRSLMAGIAVLGLGSGCVAFDVGKPTVYETSQTENMTSSTPDARALEKVSATLEHKDSRAVVSLRAAVREDFPKKECERHVAVRVQKRLAFGLFPAFAEAAHPKGALDSGWDLYADHQEKDPVPHKVYLESTPFPGCCLPVEAVFLVVGTLNSLLLEPFGDWDCKTHIYYDQAGSKKHTPRSPGQSRSLVVDPSLSPKMQALLMFPHYHKRRNPYNPPPFGFRTCWDVEKKESLAGKFIGHCGLVGFHKHLAVFIDTDTETRKTGDVETRRRTMPVAGPWEVELRIPALDFEERAVAGKGEESVSFALPEVDAAGTYDATLVFRAAPEPAPWPGNEVLPKIEGKTAKKTIVLPASGNRE